MQTKLCLLIPHLNGDFNTKFAPLLGFNLKRGDFLEFNHKLIVLIFFSCTITEMLDAKFRNSKEIKGP